MPPFPLAKNGERHFDGVITNPPFGSLGEWITIDGAKIRALDHLMAIHALNTMQDSGRAFIIIGGHFAWDDKDRIVKGKNRWFFNYLHKHYNVADVIQMSGDLYRKMGTSFPTRLILIDGRKAKPQGFHPGRTERDTVVETFPKLFERVSKAMKGTPKEDWAGFSVVNENTPLRFRKGDPMNRSFDKWLVLNRRHPERIFLIGDTAEFDELGHVKKGFHAFGDDGVKVSKLLGTRQQVNKKALVYTTIPANQIYRAQYELDKAGVDYTTVGLKLAEDRNPKNLLPVIAEMETDREKLRNRWNGRKLEEWHHYPVMIRWNEVRMAASANTILQQINQKKEPPVVFVRGNYPDSLDMFLTFGKDLEHLGKVIKKNAYTNRLDNWQKFQQINFHESEKEKVEEWLKQAGMDYVMHDGGIELHPKDKQTKQPFWETDLGKAIRKHSKWYGSQAQTLRDRLDRREVYAIGDGIKPGEYFVFDVSRKFANALGLEPEEMEGPVREGTTILNIRNLSKEEIKQRLDKAGIEFLFSGEPDPLLMAEAEAEALLLKLKMLEIKIETAKAMGRIDKMRLAEAEAAALRLRIEMLEIDELGAPYIPRSEGCIQLNTVVPDSMDTEIKTALARAEKEIGKPLSEFVRERLDYPTQAALCKALSAEQVDAVALAIWNIENRSQGLIEGDQTGIGKGRVAASMIRYAVKQGHKPVFLTEKPDLFTDMYRDLLDIGSEDILPFIVNRASSRANVKDRAGNVVYRALGKDKQDDVFQSQHLPTEFDCVFATYSNSAVNATR